MPGVAARHRWRSHRHRAEGLARPCRLRLLSDTRSRLTHRIVPSEQTVVGSKRESWRSFKILEPELQRSPLLILHPLGLHLAQLGAAYFPGDRFGKFMEFEFPHPVDRRVVGNVGRITGSHRRRCQRGFSSRMLLSRFGPGPRRELSVMAIRLELLLRDAIDIGFLVDDIPSGSFMFPGSLDQFCGAAGKTGV